MSKKVHKTKQSSFLLQLSALVLFLAIFTGFTLLNKSQTFSHKENTPVEVHEQEYQDERVGYSIDIPKNWIIWEEPAYKSDFANDLKSWVNREWDSQYRGSEVARVILASNKDLVDCISILFSIDNCNISNKSPTKTNKASPGSYIVISSDYRGGKNIDQVIEAEKKWVPETKYKVSKFLLAGQKTYLQTDNFESKHSRECSSCDVESYLFNNTSTDLSLTFNITSVVYVGLEENWDNEVRTEFISSQRQIIKKILSSFKFTD